MKNLLKLSAMLRIAIIALAVVIGFSMAGCDLSSGTRTVGGEEGPDPGPGPGPGPSSQVVLFEDGEWIDELGEVTEELKMGDSEVDTFVITFENPYPLAGCTKLVLEFTSGTMANQYWYGGQLAFLDGPGEADDKKLNYWSTTGVNFANLIWTFELTKADANSDTVTALEEIVTKAWTAKPVLKKVYLDKTAVTPPSGPGTGPGTGPEPTWYLTAEEDGTNPAPGNAVVVTNDVPDYVYIFFDPVATLSSIKIFFTAPGLTLTKQCAYDDTGTYGWGWGSVTSGDEWTLAGAGKWYDSNASKTELDKSKLKGLCIGVEGTGTFTLTNVVIE